MNTAGLLPPLAVPPLLVGPAVIRGCGAALLAASAQIDDLGSFAAAHAVVPGWAGVAAEAYGAKVRPLGREADAMSLAVRGVARRVDVHAERMQSLLTAREDLVVRRGQLVAEIDRLDGQVAAAAVQQAAALAGERELLRRSVDDLDDDVRRWQGDVRTEEEAMSAAFSRMRTVEQVERGYGGVADPADAALLIMPPAGAAPALVRAWWAALGIVQRRAILAAAPGAIGNLGGVPARARDAANAVSLDRDLAAWSLLEEQGLITDDERGWLANARAADDARHLVSTHVDPVDGLPLSAQLYSYDPRAFGGDGTVAIGVGDLDRADNLAVVVPGLGTDAQSAAFQAQRALTLHDAARSLDPGASTATMAWIGYDAPDNLPGHGGWDGVGVAGEQLATAGGDRLADTVDGLRAEHPGAATHLTVIGHSYGSTTLGHAAYDEGLPVDDVVVVGSPGLGAHVHHAADLGVDPAHVWDGSNSRDPVAALADDGWVGGHTFGGAGLGDDPAEDAFGGHRFTAESVTRGAHHAFTAHSAYFTPQSESLYNIAEVVDGQYASVQLAAPIHDPWYASPQDPEWDRAPTSPYTGW